MSRQMSPHHTPSLAPPQQATPHTLRTRISTAKLINNLKIASNRRPIIISQTAAAGGAYSQSEGDPFSIFHEVPTTTNQSTTRTAPSPSSCPAFSSSGSPASMTSSMPAPPLLLPVATSSASSSLLLPQLRYSGRRPPHLSSPPSSSAAALSLAGSSGHVCSGVASGVARLAPRITLAMTSSSGAPSVTSEEEAPTRVPLLRYSRSSESLPRPPAHHHYQNNHQSHDQSNLHPVTPTVAESPHTSLSSQKTIIATNRAAFSSISTSSSVPCVASSSQRVVTFDCEAPSFDDDDDSGGDNKRQPISAVKKPPNEAPTNCIQVNTTANASTASQAAANQKPHSSTGRATNKKRRHKKTTGSSDGTATVTRSNASTTGGGGACAGRASSRRSLTPAKSRFAAPSEEVVCQTTTAPSNSGTSGISKTSSSFTSVQQEPPPSKAQPMGGRPQQQLLSTSISSELRVQQQQQKRIVTPKPPMRGETPINSASFRAKRSPLSIIEAAHVNTNGKSSDGNAAVTFDCASSSSSSATSSANLSAPSRVAKPSPLGSVNNDVASSATANALTHAHPHTTEAASRTQPATMSAVSGAASKTTAASISTTSTTSTVSTLTSSTTATRNTRRANKSLDSKQSCFGDQQLANNTRNSTTKNAPVTTANKKPPPIASHRGLTSNNGSSSLSTNATHSQSGSNKYRPQTSFARFQTTPIPSSFPSPHAPLSSGPSGAGHQNASGNGGVTLDWIASQILSRRIRQIVILAGAGISTDCGIPDFRSPGSGLYHNLAQFQIPYPEAIFELDFFRTDPRPFCRLARELYPDPSKFRPGLAHCLFRLLDQKGLLLRLYTQNIDGLERMAGLDPDKFIEAHGSFSTASCIQCRLTYPSASIARLLSANQIPVCGRCTGLVKPDVVFFGENLPQRFFASHSRDLSNADLLLIMGTSLQVQPFAGLTQLVRFAVPRVLFNRMAVGEFRPRRRHANARSGSGVTVADSQRAANNNGGGGAPRRPNDLAMVGELNEKLMQFVDALRWGNELDRVRNEISEQLDQKSASATTVVVDGNGKATQDANETQAFGTDSDGRRFKLIGRSDWRPHTALNNRAALFPHSSSAVAVNQNAMIRFRQVAYSPSSSSSSSANSSSSGAASPVTNARHKTPPAMPLATSNRSRKQRANNTSKLSTCARTANRAASAASTSSSSSEAASSSNSQNLSQDLDSDSN